MGPRRPDRRQPRRLARSGVLATRSLAAKAEAVHRSLEEAGIPHAFGGALALAYYAEPRETRDIDVNVFVPAQESESKFDWEGTPVHFFFSCDPLHEEMKRRIRRVPFGDGTIPIVSPEHLIIRKALLDRTKDWLDIEQIFVATSPLDLQEIEKWMAQMAGIDDPRLAKLRNASGEFGPL
jgi:hypothetical protein